MGETGECNDEDLKKLRQLFEKYNIGWGIWT